jgi:alkylhydroperoxidase family enzyme
MTRGGDVLVALLEADKVPLETLRAKYPPLLALGETLLGVVANCHPYLEIWPTALRSYHVMLPGLVNLPFVLWGLGAPRASVGLANYVASRSAGCAYCSAHTCTFALRRGVSVEEVASALDGDAKALSPANRAAVRVARALSVVPADITDEDRRAMRRHFSPADEEWIVLGIARMGWLNKMMDALGVPLEEPTVAEVRNVISHSGWAPGKHLAGRDPAETDLPPVDSLATKLGLLRHVPKAMALVRGWTRSVPSRWPATGAFLEKETGHSFPVLGRLHHGRAIRAIATMLRDDIGRGVTSIVGRETKLGAGLIFAEAVGNDRLASELRACGATKLTEDSPAYRLAQAIAPSPVRVDADVVAASRALAPAAIVELIAFVALAQLLHRLESYYVEGEVSADHSSVVG